MSNKNNAFDRDFYQILDCEPDSTYEELKEAYRTKVLEFHPDKSSNAQETIGTFCEVQTAWETLKNPELRQKYDLVYREACVEADTALVYARIVLSELRETEDQNILSYPCRCGNSYLVQKTDLDVNCIVHVPCQDCTFVIAIET